MTKEKDISRVLAKLEYGIYVLTMGNGSNGNAFTASWLSQVSSDPPTIMVAVNNKHQSARLLGEMSSFAVNLLPQGQEAVARTFYGPAESGYEKLQANHLSNGPATGCPLIAGAAGYLDCRIVKRSPVGNHTVFFGEVLAAGLMEDVNILTSSNSKMRYSG